MKFTIKTPPTFDEVKVKLTEKFPNYELKMRNKQFLVAKKTATCGVNILIRKDKMLVVGNFPSMGAQLLFTLAFILGGIIIPLIVYFAVFHKKFKAMEQEVGGFLNTEYGEE